MERKENASNGKKGKGKEGVWRVSINPVHKFKIEKGKEMGGL